MDSKTASSISYVFVLGMIGTLLGYAIRIFLSHSLSVHDFGLFYSALAVVGIINIFKDLGTNTALIKFVAEYNIKQEVKKIKSAVYTSFLIQFIIVGVSTLVFFAYAREISLMFFGNENAATLLKILILSSLCSVVFTVCQITLNGFKRMKEFSFVEPVRSSVSLITMIMLASLGLIGAASGYLIAAIVTSVIFFIVTIRIFPDVLKPEIPSRNVAEQLLVFGTLFLAGSFSTYIVQYTDTIVITLVRSVEEVGYYQTAIATIQFVPLFVAAIGAVLFPIISELYASGKKENLEQIISIFVTLSFFAVLPIVILVFSFPEIFIRLLYGEKFLPATDALRILSIGSIFYSVFLILQTTLLGLGKPGLNTKVLIIISVLDIAANLMLVPILGIQGAAVTFVLSYFIGVVLAYRYVDKLVKIKLNKAKITKIIIGAVLTTGLIFAMKSLIHPYAYLEAVIIVIPASIFYLGLMIVTRTVERKDVEYLRSMKIPIPKAVANLFK